MCGINILVDKTRGRFGPEAIRRMNAALRHRGPDGEPHYERIPLDWATVWLGSTRLALRGGEAGEQPMHSPGGRVALVYNGEIYDLAREGGSDTTALAAFLETAAQNPDRGYSVNGMYAFGYVDHAEGVLHLGRDPLGIKPLFMAKAGFGYAFSSEAEGLLAVGLLPGLEQRPQPLERLPLPSHERVAAWLDRRHPGVGATLFGPEGLVSSNAVHGLNEPAIRMDFLAPAPDGFDLLKPYSLKPLMLEVLERQLVSDRPVGLMLSGGYDSAFLLACLNEMGRKVPCYTLSGTPDAEPAARMARKLGFPHRPVPMPDANRGWQDLEAYMQGRIHPIADSGGFAIGLVARAARHDGVPVLLSGAGADELLGGYRRHQALWKLQPWARMFGFRLDKRAFDRMLRWNSLAYLARHKQRRPFRWPDIEGRFTEPYDPRHDELADYLAHDVLMVTDHATMAHGVEARVPYLDSAVVEACLRMSWRHIMSAEYKFPLVEGLKEAGLFELLLKEKVGFGLWDTGIFQGLPVMRRLREPGHVLYEYLDFARVRKELQAGTPHARFSVAQLAYTLEFIQGWR